MKRYSKIKLLYFFLDFWSNFWCPRKGNCLLFTIIIIIIIIILLLLLSLLLLLLLLLVLGVFFSKLLISYVQNLEHKATAEALTLNLKLLTKYLRLKSLISIFQGFSCSSNKTSILGRRLGTRLSFYEV